MKTVVVETVKQLEEAAPTGNIIIWNGKEDIDKVLEEIGPYLDNYSKANLKLCKQIYFKKPVTIKKSSGDSFSANSLSEILEILEDSSLDSKDSKDLVIIESNDISEAINLIQQFINLGINASVLTREEILKKKLIQNFFEQSETIKNLLESFKKKVESTKVYFDTIEESKKIITDLIRLVEEHLTKGADRTIKVAVFATKKTGKSMIVNALLGEEYAPTSQELPTPNVIIYKPHNKKFIKLIYRNKELNFKSAKELKEYIKNEFKKVEISGDKLPVMTILYPQKKGINFEVYDTPGPDLAGSQHGDFIDEYIEKADVSVFAIDYTKYAQDSEIELLKKIKNSFEKKGKIYSLVCVINKLDMMYLDTDTEKIRVRVSYFIEKKLKNLGFKNFVVIPISAIIYFYITKLAEYIEDIKNVENLRTYLLEIEDDEESLEKLNIPVEMFSEINAFVGKIKSVHKIRKPTYKDVVNISGFETFRKYLLYIAEEKAFVEKVLFHIKVIESAFTEIHNYIETSYALLSEETKRLKEAIENFKKNANEEFIRESFEEFFEKVEKEFSEKVDNTFYSTFQEIRRIIEDQIFNFREDLRKKIEEDAIKLEKKEISRDDFVKKYKKLSFSINRDYIIDAFKKNYKRLEGYLKEYKEEYKKTFEETKSTLSNAIESLEKELSRSFSETDKIISIKIPELDLELEIEEVIKAIEEEINRIKFSFASEISEAIFNDAIKGGILKWIGSFLGGKRYEVNEELLWKEIDKETRNIEENLLKEIQASFFSSIKNLNKLKEIFKANLKRNRKETDRYLNSIYTPILQLEYNLNKERKEKQALVEFLQSLANEWQALFTTWKKNVIFDYSEFEEGA